MHTGHHERAPCRNGPNCYYLHHGTCWFSHPDWHRNHRLLNTVRIPPVSHLNIIRTNPHPQIYNPIRIRTMNDLIQTLDMRSQLEELSKKPQVQKPAHQAKQLIIGDKQVKLISISSQLNKQKAWFFENSYHFHHFPGCEIHECSICISNFQEGDLLSTFFCKHGFHNKCIEEWLKTSQQCPLCRHDFRDHDAFKSMSGYSAPSKNKSPSIANYLAQNMGSNWLNISGDDEDSDLSFEDYEDDEDYEYVYNDFNHDQFDEFDVDFDDY